MAQIKLVSIPSLDNTYQNVVDFSSLSSQTAWFDNKPGRIVEGNIKTDTEQDVLTLNTTYASIKPYDYLYFNDVNGKRIYYFIMSKKIKTADVCEVVLECDVWNTYMFDYNMMDCYVERCHVPRWFSDKVPSLEIVDEGLPLDEYIVATKEKIADLEQTYVMVSTTPLGYLKAGGYVPPTGGNGNGSSGACGNINEGAISPKGFRFIKGYEAFGPYAYDDGFGYMTIAYGITRHGEPDIYNQLLTLQPVPEETGAKISYNLKTDNYGMVIKDAFLAMGYTEIHKFDAVVSFAYNLGVGVMRPGHSFHDALATKNESIIRNEWMKYINAGGVPVEGLRLRRKAELDIFFDMNYEMRAIPLLNASGNIVGTVKENEGNGWLPECSGGSSPVGINFETDFGTFACPTTGIVSAHYPLYPSGGVHNGIDIANIDRTPIYASRAGTVIISGAVSGYGYAIYIDHGQGIITRYGHIIEGGLLVKVGDVVYQGQPIALMGNTGQSTGTHLHYELRVNDVPKNPAKNIVVGQELKKE